MGAGANKDGAAFEGDDNVLSVGSHSRLHNILGVNANDLQLKG